MTEVGLFLGGVFAVAFLLTFVGVPIWALLRLMGSGKAMPGPMTEDYGGGRSPSPIDASPYENSPYDMFDDFYAADVGGGGE